MIKYVTEINGVSIKSIVEECINYYTSVALFAKELNVGRKTIYEMLAGRQCYTSTSRRIEKLYKEIKKNAA